MSWSLVTPPTGEVISLDAAKEQCRIDHSDEDRVIAGLITAARQRYEGPNGMLCKAFLTQTWDYWADQFPSGCRVPWLDIPLAPIQSVSFVKYTDSGGVLQTMPGADYQTDLVSVPARLLLSSGGAWPLASSGGQAVNVRVVAGYGDNISDVPELIIRQMLLLIDHWYQNRGADGAKFPEYLDQIALPYRGGLAV